jgi:hypothetical protein
MTFPSKHPGDDSKKKLKESRKAWEQQADKGSKFGYARVKLIDQKLKNLDKSNLENNSF